MKKWCYRIIWVKDGRQIPDGKVFTEEAKALQYAKEQLLQYGEYNFRVETLELVD